MTEDASSAAARRAAITSQIQAETGIDEAMIERLVRRFYARVRDDDVLGPIFAAQIDDWEPHLRKMSARALSPRSAGSLPRPHQRSANARPGAFRGRDQRQPVHAIQPFALQTVLVSGQMLTAKGDQQPRFHCSDAPSRARSADPCLFAVRPQAAWRHPEPLRSPAAVGSAPCHGFLPRTHEAPPPCAPSVRSSLLRS